MVTIINLFPKDARDYSTTRCEAEAVAQ